MSYKERMADFVRNVLVSDAAHIRFREMLLALASETSQATLTTAGLDMRQIDAMHGMTTACFRILDEAEKALNAQRGKANPGSEGGFQ